MIGVGIGVPFGVANLAGAVQALFAAGEQGAWYDPSDFSTLFQDSAGTTPVTATTQPVGLVLDKRLNLVRGPELVINGDNEAGTFGGTTAGSFGLVSQSGERAHSGAFSAKYACNDATAGDHLVTAYTVPAGKAVEVSVWAYNPTGNFASLTLVDASDGSWNGTTSTVKDGWVQLRGIRPPKATVWPLAVGSQGGIAGLGFIFYVDDLSVRELAGNHATQATATSRPTLQQDASGFYCLNFDGVDDSLATGSIDFTATAQMTAWAGVLKASDAAAGTVAELSAAVSTVNGSFQLAAPASANPGFGFRTRGTLLSLADINAGYPAPTSAVLTGVGGIASDTAILRINGTQATTSATDQGTGNYSNNPIYIGARAGTSLLFNGRLYSLIVRGATSSATQISNAERFVGSRMGIAL